MNKKILISLLYLLILAGTAHAVLRVTDLRTEQLKNPLGIDIRHPRLGWRIESDEQNVMQTAYHILVASSPELLAQGKGDCWDSGKVKTDASQWITYQGETLKRNTPYYWKVKVYTHTNETDWSEPASWSMGLLNEADWQGQWIGLDRPAPGDRMEPPCRPLPPQRVCTDQRSETSHSTHCRNGTLRTLYQRSAHR